MRPGESPAFFMLAPTGDFRPPELGAPLAFGPWILEV